MKEKRDNIPLVNLSEFVKAMSQLDINPEQHTLTSLKTILSYRFDTYVVVEYSNQRALFNFSTPEELRTIPETVSLPPHIKDFLVDHGFNVVGFLIKVFEIDETTKVSKQGQNQKISIEYSLDGPKYAHYNAEGLKCDPFEEPLLKMFVWGHELKRNIRSDSLDLTSSFSNLVAYDRTRFINSDTLYKVIYYVGFDANKEEEITVGSFKVQTINHHPGYHLKLEYNK